MNIKRDKITITGAVLGIASLLFPPITLKPNRVDDGSPLSWLETGGFPLVILIILLLLLLLFLGIKSSQNQYLRTKFFLAFTLFVLVLIFSGPKAGSFLNDSIPYGRITLSSGFWIFLAALSLILNNMLLYIKKRWLRFLYQALPLLILFIFIISGGFNSLSLTMEFLLKKERVITEIGNHLRLAGTAVFLSLCIGIPLGVLSWKRKKSEKPIFYFLNSVQTIPSLALFGLLIAPLSYLSFRFPFLREMGIQGIGNTPALIALTLYALLPVARNTYIGLSIVDTDTLQAGQGMGMGPWQLFFSVEVPMALPVILSGIRISAIQAVGNTAVAALIGAGGLGIFIFQGLGQGAPDLILIGVIPVIALAVLLDRLLSFVFNLSVSPGLILERNNG
ncbi:MAG: ABC transporter permease [Spirochaetaceae bacterium]|nr:ABC transporter permease [Spirochaetaceae bacterium]